MSARGSSAGAGAEALNAGVCRRFGTHGIVVLGDGRVGCWDLVSTCSCRARRRASYWSDACSPVLFEALGSVSMNTPQMIGMRGLIVMPMLLRPQDE
jgi:hypothetical protein